MENPAAALAVLATDGLEQSNVAPRSLWNHLIVCDSPRAMEIGRHISGASSAQGCRFEKLGALGCLLTAWQRG